MEIKSSARVFGGTLLRITHDSTSCACPMTFALFVPASSTSTSATPLSTDVPDVKFPLLFYLSGLTCSDENACHKLGAFESLAAHQMACIFPDTSPRGCNVPGESDSWDFGVGAGFYIDATNEPWALHWKMETYIAKELPAFLSTHFAFCLDLERVAITGHSMGGHGAISLAIKHPLLFKSVSAFAPISNPCQCPWGVKAFTEYLGKDESDWEKHDSTFLIAQSPFSNILVDVGAADNFFKQGQLLPENLRSAANAAGKKITLRFHAGYGHDFYFYQSLIAHHVAFHADRLSGAGGEGDAAVALCNSFSVDP